MQNIHARKEEGSFLPERLQDFSRTTFQEGSFQVMFVGTQHTEEQKGVEYV